MEFRRGEEERVWYRFERFYRTSDGWFFTTREGSEVGPFANRHLAENGARIFLDSIRKRHVVGTYASQLAMSGLWATTHYQ